MKIKTLRKTFKAITTDSNSKSGPNIIKNLSMSMFYSYLFQAYNLTIPIVSLDVSSIQRNWGGSGISKSYIKTTQP